MTSLTPFKVGFTLDLRLLLLAVVFFLLFVFLGFWQINRADEKKLMLAAERSLEQQKPLQWQEKHKMPLQYQSIKVSGHYLSDLFFLDNQHHDHQFGYDVITPFELSNKKIILIDRGWIKGDITRKSLPKVKTPTSNYNLTGKAYYPSAKSWTLGEAIEKRGPATTIIERLDTEIISQLLHKSVYPFIIRLDKNEASGFVREWLTVSMPPERHYAYAVQWFALASLILILFIALNFKKTK